MNANAASLALTLLSMFCAFVAVCLVYVRHVWFPRHSYLFFEYGRGLFGVYYDAKYGVDRR